jgi:hypothetical protein
MNDIYKAEQSLLLIDERDCAACGKSPINSTERNFIKMRFSSGGVIKVFETSKSTLLGVLCNACAGKLSNICNGHTWTNADDILAFWEKFIASGADITVFYKEDDGKQNDK